MDDAATHGSTNRKNGKKKSKADPGDNAASNVMEPQTTDLTANLFVERDYSRGVFTRFSETFPASLNVRGVSPQQFQSLVRQINTYLEESEDVTCTTFWESFLAFFTFYSSLLCTTPSSLKTIAAMKNYIATENSNYWLPRGLEILNPIENGCLFLEIKVHPSPEH